MIFIPNNCERRTHRVPVGQQLRDGNDGADRGGGGGSPDALAAVGRPQLGGVQVGHHLAGRFFVFFGGAASVYF